jgi:hypothetical protein
MPIAITCAGCGLTGSAPDKLHGKTIKCQRCETAIKVQRPSMVVPVDAALLQQAAATPPPPRPTPRKVNPAAQPRVSDFAFKDWLGRLLLAGVTSVILLIFYAVARSYVR